MFKFNIVAPKLLNLKEEGAPLTDTEIQLHSPMHTLLENVGHEVENIDFIYFERAFSNEVRPQKGESKEMDTPVFKEPLLGYYPCTCCIKSQYQPAVKLHGVFPSSRG